MQHRSIYKEQSRLLLEEEKIVSCLHQDVAYLKKIWKVQSAMQPSTGAAASDTDLKKLIEKDGSVLWIRRMLNKLLNIRDNA